MTDLNFSLFLALLFWFYMLWLESCYSGFDCLELLEESWSQI